MDDQSPDSTGNCPPREGLLRMLEGTASGPDAEAVERHVDACTACQRLLEAMTGEPDGPAPTEYRTLPDTFTPAIGHDPGRTVSSGPLEIPGYEIQGELGRGGMGIVYLARQVRAGRLVAIKTVLSGDRVRSDDLTRFRLEAESLARLQHPNIVQVYEVGEADGLPFFSMEYVAGGTIARGPGAGRRSFDPLAAAALVETIARAVHAAHQAGVIHRDLKPANVLIGEGKDTPGEGGTGREVPKVTDFGLAKVIGEDSGLTRTGQVMGTPSYMAPEQASGGTPVGIPSDIYSLGAILYELLAGRPPFLGASPWETMMQVVHEPPEPPSRHRPGVPRDLEQICLKCLAKDPAGRYASAAALADDLGHFQAGEPVSARPAGLSRRARLWARRHPASAALTLLLLASVAAGVVGVVAQWLRAERNLADSRANFALARRAVDDLLTRISEDRLIAQPGFQGLRRELLGEAASFYREFAARRGEDPAIRAEVVRARAKLGDIEMTIGNPGQAEAELLKAVEEAGPPPRPADVELARVVALCRLSEARSRGNRPDESLAAAAEAVVAARGVAGPSARRAESFALRQHGHSLGKIGRNAEAEGDFRESIRLLNGLGNSPDGADVRELRATSIQLASLLTRGAGRAADALIALGDAEVRCKGAIDRPDATPEDRADLADVLLLRGNYLSQVLERWDEARDSLASANELLVRLARENPLVFGYRMQLFSSLYVLGYIDLRHARYRDAEARYRQASEVLEGVIREDPARGPGLSIELGSLLIDLAEVRRRRGDPAGAAAILNDQCIPRAREAAEARAASVQTRLLPAMAHRYLARCLLDDGDAPGSAEAAQHAGELLGSLADTPDTEGLNREELARVRVASGEALRALGRGPAAEEALGRAISVVEELIKANPDAPDRADILGYALARRSALRRARGDSDGASADALRAVSLLERLPAADPDRLLRLAAARSIAGRPPAEVVDALRRAEDGGLASPQSIRSDPELAQVRDLPAFAEILRRVEARSAEGK